MIAKMIRKAKRDYLDTGLSSLLWGSVIIICSLVAYVNSYLNIPALNLVWFLTVVAVVPQIVIAIREGKKRGSRYYEEDQVGGIWIAFGITMFLFGFIFSRFPTYDGISALYLAVYGIPTFATGYARKFKPGIFGGIACWVLAVLSLYTPDRYSVFLMAGGALLAWFIPGLILRMRYLKAKQQHV